MCRNGNRTMSDNSQFINVIEVCEIHRQTRKFTPRDGSQRTVYEVVARSAHQIVRRNGKEAASDNAPDAKDQVVPAPEEHVESTDDGEVWPS